MLVPSLEDTLTYGQLIAALRDRAGLQGQQLAERLNIRPPKMAFIERCGHLPTRAELLRIADALELKAGEYTALLAAADYALDNDEWDRSYALYAPLLERYTDPVCLLDHQTYVLCWNSRFQALYDQGVALASRRVPRGGEAESFPPSLSVGMCALELFLDEGNPLHHLVARGDRTRLGDALVTWFNDMTRRWDLPRLGGKPQWVLDLLTHVQELQARIEEHQQDDIPQGYDPGAAPPAQHQDTTSPLPPTFSIAGTRYELDIQRMPREARLYRLQLIRADGDSLVAQRPTRKSQRTGAEHGGKAPVAR